MNISIIVAASENDVIGADNRMIWRLSEDMKRFKKLTTGHTVVMGRKTFESLGRPLPNRVNVVITRNPNYRADGCQTADSIEAALKTVAEADEVFVIGGGDIYRQLWNRADKLYLTRVHTTIMGDTMIPAISEEYWKEEERENHSADEKNEYDYSFINYTKR